MTLMLASVKIDKCDAVIKLAKHKYLACKN